LDVARRFENVLLGKSCLDSYGIIRVAALNKTRLLRPIFGSEKLLLAELALLGGYCEVDEELFYSRLHQAMAGALETSKSQHEFISPLTAPPHWIRMRLLWGYVTAVARAPISPIARLKSLGKIGKYLLQIRKWRSVILRTLLGKGTGGDVRIAT
jgi:hypothetical protein